MRKCWKQLAERADIAAYSPDEVIRYMEAALHKDVATEIPSKELAMIRDVIESSETTLFPDDTQSLEGLKGQQSGNPMADCLIDCIVASIDQGNKGLNAVENGLKDALQIWNSRHILQVEEHYLRESNRSRADNIRERLETAAEGCDLGKVASELLGSQQGANALSYAKQSGLDDGVQL